MSVLGARVAHLWASRQRARVETTVCWGAADCNTGVGAACGADVALAAPPTACTLHEICTEEISIISI